MSASHSAESGRETRDDADHLPGPERNEHEVSRRREHVLGHAVVERRQTRRINEHLRKLFGLFHGDSLLLVSARIFPKPAPRGSREAFPGNPSRAEGALSPGLWITLWILSLSRPEPAGPPPETF